MPGDPGTATAGELPAWASYLQAYANDLTAELQALHGLPNPQTDAVIVSSFFSKMQDLVSAAGSAIAAAHQHNLPEFSAAMGVLTADQTEATNLADDFGFQVCGSSV